ENCSLITETLSGELQLCRWNEQSLGLDILRSIMLVQTPPNSPIPMPAQASRPAPQTATHSPIQAEIQPRDVA
ncbi:MAG: UDP-2,3-diacylglucosamine diphosphatase, partial [Shewanella sp.]